MSEQHHNTPGIEKIDAKSTLWNALTKKRDGAPYVTHAAGLTNNIGTVIFSKRSMISTLKFLKFLWRLIVSTLKFMWRWFDPTTYEHEVILPIIFVVAILVLPMLGDLLEAAGF